MILLLQRTNPHDIKKTQEKKNTRQKQKPKTKNKTIIDYIFKLYKLILFSKNFVGKYFKKKWVTFSGFIDLYIFYFNY